MIHREIVTIHRRKVSILKEMTLNLSEIVLISPAFITSKLYVICGKKKKIGNALTNEGNKETKPVYKNIYL
jgi:GTP-sensing pleiotropic transcriptional regulator CodY